MRPSSGGGTPKDPDWQSKHACGSLFDGLDRWTIECVAFVLTNEGNRTEREDVNGDKWKPYAGENVECRSQSRNFGTRSRQGREK